MPRGDGWSGRRAQAAKVECQRRWGFTCWLCGHTITDPGDYTVDHVIERKKAPHLTWDPNNHRPAHGRKHPELGCPGNFGRSGRKRRRVLVWTAPGW